LLKVCKFNFDSKEIYVTTREAAYVKVGWFIQETPSGGLRVGGEARL